jgi:hypothetical protein
LVRGRSSVQSTPAAPISKTYSAPLGTTQQNTARTCKLNVEKTLNFVPGMFRVVFVGLLESPTTDSHKKSDSKKPPAPKNRGKDQ